MSSSRITSDKKTITFDLTHNHIVGTFMLSFLNGNVLNPDKILMRMDTQSSNGCDSSSNSTSVVISKDYTKVLSHFFRHAADLMDEWYKE